MKDERILRTTALYCLAVMIIVIFVSISIKYKETHDPSNVNTTPIPTSISVAPTAIPLMIEYITPDIHSDIEADWSIWNVLLTEQKEELAGVLGDKSIIIRKPENAQLSFSVSSNMLKHSIQIEIIGAQEGTISPTSVLRMSGEKCFIGIPKGMLMPTDIGLEDTTTESEEEVEQNQDLDSNEDIDKNSSDTADKTTEEGATDSEPVKETATTEEYKTNGDLLTSLSIDKYDNEGEQITTLSCILDGYYIPEIHETSEYYILALRRPKELYQKIVVIDAGHGGHDPGAGAENWTITEANLNLKMLLHLKEYLDADPEIQAYYTRTDNTYPTLPERVELANGVEADLFISIHCNSTVQSKSNGSAVMYNAEQGLEDDFCSKDLAKLCLNHLLQTLGTKSVGIIKRPDLHIVRRAEMPVVLIETAYMSNPHDLSILKNDDYLKAVGETLYQAILEAYTRMEQSEKID